MPGLFSAAADILCLCLCTAVIGIVKVSVCIQHLSVKEPDPLSFPGSQTDLHIACHFLPEIHHRLSGRCSEHFFCPDPLSLPDLLPLLRDQQLRRPFHRFRLLPFLR